MRTCERCRFPALIAGDYGGAAPIPCGFCGGRLGEWFHRDSERGLAADKYWFHQGGKRKAEKLRQLDGEAGECMSPRSRTGAPSEEGDGWQFDGPARDFASRLFHLLFDQGEQRVRITVEVLDAPEPTAGAAQCDDTCCGIRCRLAAGHSGAHWWRKPEPTAGDGEGGGRGG